MKIVALKGGLLAGAFTLALATVGATVVVAEESHSQVTPTHSTTSTSEKSVKPSDSTRLSDTRVKICEVRQKTITTILGRMAERGQKQIELFTSIAERTEKFYTEKGKTLSNYNALVAEVTAKKVAAQTAVAAINTKSTGFSCQSDNPKGFVDTFKDSLKQEQATLKEYKTAVKNLIVGVKSVQGTTSSDKETKV